jgi:hypothetical protein
MASEAEYDLAGPTLTRIHTMQELLLPSKERSSRTLRERQVNKHMDGPTGRATGHTIDSSN